MRIFVAPDQLVCGELAIRGDEHHYLARVRRARAGDTIDLVDGVGHHATAVIARITDGETVLDVGEPAAIVSASPFVRALLPLIKGDRMDAALEKLVEVGVDAIVVWPAMRSVVKLDGDRQTARIAKYQAAVQAAARQCGRAQIPPVTWADDLASALRALPTSVRFVLDPASEEPLEVPVEASDVTIVSGPEGGLAPTELEALAGFMPVGLGPRVLRAETAPVVAIAVIRAATRS